MGETREDPKKHLHDIVETFHAAMFVSLKESGELHARPMTIAGIEGDSDMWFATFGDSSLIHEIARTPKVLVTLQGNLKFATLWGTAEIVEDRRIVERLWKEAWKTWFKGGKDDPMIRLVKVRVGGGEYWDQSPTRGVRFLVEAVKAYVEGKTPELVPELSEGQHGRVGA